MACSLLQSKTKTDDLDQCKTTVTFTVNQHEATTQVKSPPLVTVEQKQCILFVLFPNWIHRANNSILHDPKSTFSSMMKNSVLYHWSRRRISTRCWHVMMLTGSTRFDPELSLACSFSHSSRSKIHCHLTHYPLAMLFLSKVEIQDQLSLPIHCPMWTTLACQGSSCRWPKGVLRSQYVVWDPASSALAMPVLPHSLSARTVGPSVNSQAEIHFTFWSISWWISIGSD